MIYTHPEVLNKKITEAFYHCYILYGNDSFLLEENKQIIINHAKYLNFCKPLYFVIQNDTHWEQIFHLYQTQNLFDHKKKFFY